MAITTVAGLFLTRFYLNSLGQKEYGYWLIASQIVGYALLLDLGIVALLPRETAFATGRAGGWRESVELPEIVGRTTRLVMWQLPVLVIVLVPVWIFLPSDWEPLRWPLALVLASFVVLFPLRIPGAVLIGLQDLSFTGLIQFFAWMVNTAITVGLILGGFGLFAFAVGFASSQLVSAAVCLHRVRSRYPGVLPRRLSRVPAKALRDYVGKAAWVSVAQVAQILIFGTDAVVVGWLLWPTAVVPYVITGKLFSVMGNQPNLLMQAAGPGLSEMRMAAAPAIRFSATLALG